MPKTRLDQFETEHLEAWIANHYAAEDRRTVRKNIVRFLNFSERYDYANRGWSDTVRAAEFVFDQVNGYVAPASPDRILRDLRQKGRVNYVVVSRAKSLYRSLPKEQPTLF